MSRPCWINWPKYAAGVSGNDFWGFGNGKGIEKAHSRNSGTGRELKKPIPKIREQEGNEKMHSQIAGTGGEWKKSIPKIQEREGNEKRAFPEFGNGKGMKKNIPNVQEWESEAIIPKNGWEREQEKITMIRTDWKCCEMFWKQG